MKMQVPNTPRYFSALKAFLMMQVNSTGFQTRYTSSLKFANLREKDSQQKSTNYIGEGNSQYGTVWVCNPDTGENKKVKNDSQLEVGFFVGRDLTKRICPVCGNEYVKKSSYETCSNECSNKKRINSFKNSQREHKSKLTQEIVDDIRSNIYSNMTNADLGRKFNVSATTIFYIKSGRIWN